MKRYGSFFKNIAALIMLLALLSLLLPVCKITTNKKTSTVSGIGIMKIGADLGYEYYKNGTIKNNYVVVDTVTWGELKGGVNEGVQHKEFKKAIVVGVVVILPVLFCFLAMLFTFMAGGKIAMMFPTILIGLASFETIVGVGGFSKIQKLLLQNADDAGASLSLAIGTYAFMLLCILAFGIILALWVTGGFNRPTKRERRYYDRDDNDNDDDDDNDDKKRRRRRKKDGASRREKRRKRQRRKEKKKDRKRRKSDRKNKKNRASENNNSTQENSQSQKRPEQQDETKKAEQNENVISKEATGCLSGLNGMYQGAVMDLSNNQMSSFTIGTTKEAMDALASNSLADLEKLQGNTCDIVYSPVTKRYTISSHSVKQIILQNQIDAQNQVRLGNGDSVTVGANTLLYIGDFNNIIKLD
ncbi:MAG: hypothetical protein Q4G58_08100 [bacterium]|nr:hypothetical protein [bacterium]